MGTYLINNSGELTKQIAKDCKKAKQTLENIIN
jgi:hypothetical protein